MEFALHINDGRILLVVYVDAVSARMIQEGSLKKTILSSDILY